MVTTVRNRGCLPYVSSEGVFVKPFYTVKHQDDCYDAEVAPCERMHMHQTLASTRRYAHFKPYSGLIPKDGLDFVLSSSYNHSREYFPDKIDVFLQPDTVNDRTWRRLRNTRDLTPDREDLESKACLKREEERERDIEESERNQEKKKKKEIIIPYRYNFAHTVLIGGVTERKHPHNIKLMNSGHHSPQTNGGYSRQPSDGTLFQY